MGLHYRFTFTRPFSTTRWGFWGWTWASSTRQSEVVVPDCQFPGGKRDPGRDSGGPVCTGNGDRSQKSIQVSSLSCILQPLLYWFGAQKRLIREALSGAAPCSSRGAREMATQNSTAGLQRKPHGGLQGAGVANLGSDVGGGAGGRDARGRGRAPSRTGRRFIQKARRLRGRPCARRAGHRHRVGLGAGLLELLRGGQVRRTRGAPARRPGPEGCGPERPPLPPSVSEEVRRRGGCRSPGPAAPRPRVLSRRLPRTDPRPSLSSLPGDLCVLRPRLLARPCVMARRRRNLQFEEPAGLGDAPAWDTWTETRTGCGAGRRLLSVAAARGGRRGGSERCQPVTVGDTAREPGRTCGPDTGR